MSENNIIPFPSAASHTAGVDMSGLMSVLSRHLYSTPVVALRELVQNAHDSIVRRRIEDVNVPSACRITLKVDMAKGILYITDTGAGLTHDEIHKYLATVGVGYTRTLRQQGDDKQGLIGMFGLGFLSAFVLASDVSLVTTSYQTPTQGWCYRSKNAENYTVEQTAPRPIGTEVTLTLNKDYMHLASEGTLTRLLNHYCSLLKEPIYIGDNEQALNPESPPWRLNTNEPVFPTQYRRQCLAFAARFEQRFEPICTMDVKPSDQSDALGLLWIQDGASYGTSDNRNISVFVRGMLLDDDARDLLPTWAGFIGGVIESQDLTPTASREDLQKDEAYYHVQHALSEALINGMSEIARTQPEAWRRVLLRHNDALLAAALCDDRLFDLLAQDVRIPTSQGDVSISHLSKDGKIHVMLSSQGGFEDMLFRALRIPVAHGDRYAVLPFIRKWVSIRGGQLIELGTERGNSRFFTPASLDPADLDWLSQGLKDDEKLVPARFDPIDLPLVVVPDREAQLKKRLESDEADKRISVAALKLVRHFTANIENTADTRLFINLNNPTIQALLEARQQGNELTDALSLLKAVKIIMTVGGETQRSLDLNSALQTVNQVIVQHLIK